MTAEILMMSIKEQERAAVMQQLLDGVIKQRNAVKTLGLSSTRQVRNLANNYRKYGASGMIHGNRGKVSHRKIDDAEKQRFMTIVRQHYHDFRPAFAHEKLTEAYGFTYSVETLLQWMMHISLS